MNTTGIATAVATDAPTLSSPVTILRYLNSGWAEVLTLGGGVGGWARAGKVFPCRISILHDITETPAETPAEAPTVAQDTPSAPAVIEPPAVDDEPVSPELAAIRAQLADLRAAFQRNADNSPGWSRRRGGSGKQARLRYDAQLRRAGEYGRKIAALEAQERAMVANGGQPVVKPGPVDPSELVGAVAVRTRWGWREVVRVNAKSVTVKSGYSWTDRVPNGQVIEVRR
jgi:hypothetical protein